MKTGDQVVCVKSHEEGVVTKGKIYTVINVMEIPCGCVVIDVGIIGYNHGTCCIHGGLYECNGGIWWMHSSRFAPIQRDEFLSSDKIEKSAEEKIDIKLPETIEL